MATGPEHYQEAERLLAKATYEDLPTNAHIQDAQLAQAHATLALAAATAMGMVDLPAADWDQWRAAASAYVRHEDGAA